MNLKVVFVLFALFVCLPAILLEYGMHDDYRYLGDGVNKKDVWRLHPDMASGIVMGRPVAMFFIGIQSLVTNKISDFTWQRLVFFVSILLCSSLVYRYFTKRLLLDSVFSASLVFCIFTIPQSQFLIIWAVWSVFAGPALLLAILSYIIFDYAWRNFYFSRQWKLYSIYLSISFCVFLISLYDYPVMTLFFLVFSYANILFSKFDSWPKTRIRVIHEILFCCLGMVSYLVSYKLVYLPIILNLCPPLKSVLPALGYHSVEVSIDIPLKLKQFYIGSILSFGNILHPFLDHISGLFVFIIIFAGSVVVLIERWFHIIYRSKTIKNKIQLQELNWILQMFFISVIILPLSIAPILATGYGFTYRVLFPYSAIVVLIIFWLLRRLSFLFINEKAESAANGAAFFMVAIFGVLAQTYMLNTALSANRELKFIRQKLASIDFSKVGMLLCEKPFDRPPNEIEGALGEVRGFPVFGDLPQRHEYDHMATNRAFICEIFQAVLSEMGIKSNIIVNSYEPDLYYSSINEEKTSIINMNEIVTPVAKSAVKKQKVKGYIKSVGASKFAVCQFSYQDSGWNILKFYPSFWEETGEFPHWVSIEFNEPKTVIEYALQIGPYGQDDTGRVPQDWLFQGSNDGKKWVDLDKRSGETGWENNEKRIYKIANPSAFKFYQLYCIRGNSDIVIRLSELDLRLLF